MKMHFHTKLMALPALLCVLPAWGIEAPADDAAPPALGAPQQNGERQADQAAREVAYLGIVTGPIPELLTTHLGVRDGEGVVVRSVMPGGPADKAGIRAHDLIITMEDKPALSPAEISEIIRAHQPGDTLRVGLIQRGKGTELKVTLGSRPDEIASLGGNPMQRGHGLRGMPDDMADRIRDMIEGNMMDFPLEGNALGAGDGPADIQRMMREMQQRMRQLHELPRQGLGADEPMKLQNQTTIRVMDEQGSIEISSQNGERTLIARDQDNNIQWQGPWNNEQDKADAPEAIRERAGRLNFDIEELKMDGNGLQFQFRGGR